MVKVILTDELTKEINDSMFKVRLICELCNDCLECPLAEKKNSGIPRCPFRDLPYKWEPLK